jgi:hypothetical protein
LIHRECREIISRPTTIRYGNGQDLIHRRISRQTIVLLLRDWTAGDFDLLVKTEANDNQSKNRLTQDKPISGRHIPVWFSA